MVRMDMNALQNITDDALFRTTALEALSKLVSKVTQLEEIIRLLNARRFGASSEKEQPDLFDEAEIINDFEPEEDDEDQSVDSPPKRKTRKPLPEALPRDIIQHDLIESQKLCNCGCELTYITDVVSEQLKLIPQSVRVIQHRRKKYACRNCNKTIITAELPPQPLPKTQAAPETLAHVVVSKFLDGLPLYRQSKMLERLKINISRSTLANWVIQSGHLVVPLINLLRDELLAGPIIHADETTIQVLKEPQTSPISKKYMWVQYGGQENKRVLLFDYDPSRSSNVPLKLLEGFQGYLQTDGYKGYNLLAKSGGIEHLACWDHARRKFKEAKKAFKKTKNVKSSKSSEALNMIRKLYLIERKIKKRSNEQRYLTRQKESIPLLEKIKDWIDELLPQVPPKSLLGKALHYTHNLWQKLIIYCEDGRLSISNQVAENSIRPFAISRKNFLFAVSPQGAHASARLYSLVQTAKMNNLNPYDYLCHVFKELPKATSVEQIESLLPWNVVLEA